MPISNCIIIGFFSSEWPSQRKSLYHTLVERFPSHGGLHWTEQCIKWRTITSLSSRFFFNYWLSKCESPLLRCTSFHLHQFAVPYLLRTGPAPWIDITLKKLTNVYRALPAPPVFFQLLVFLRFFVETKPKHRKERKATHLSEAGWIHCQIGWNTSHSSAFLPHFCIWIDLFFQKHFLLIPPFVWSSWRREVCRSKSELAKRYRLKYIIYS